MKPANFKAMSGADTSALAFSFGSPGLVAFYDGGSILMACDNADTANDALLAALSGPAEVSVDGMTTKQQSLRDLIEANKYLAAKCAGRGPRRGLKFSKMIPPGID